MSMMVRVDDETHDRLRNLKREGESLDDVISRLLENREEEIEEGAGIWEGTDAAEEARDARRSMKDSVGYKSN